MCCHCQDISPSGFASPQTRPINSTVPDYDPFASIGEIMTSQVSKVCSIDFYCNSSENHAG